MLQPAAGGMLVAQQAAHSLPARPGPRGSLAMRQSIFRTSLHAGGYSLRASLQHELQPFGGGEAEALPAAADAASAAQPVSTPPGAGGGCSSEASMDGRQEAEQPSSSPRPAPSIAWKTLSILGRPAVAPWRAGRKGIRWKTDQMAAMQPRASLLSETAAAASSQPSYSSHCAPLQQLQSATSQANCPPPGSRRAHRASTGALWRLTQSSPLPSARHSLEPPAAEQPEAACLLTESPDAALEKALLSLKVLVAAGTVCAFHVGGTLQSTWDERHNMPVGAAAQLANALL